MQSTNAVWPKIVYDNFYKCVDTISKSFRTSPIDKVTCMDIVMAMTNGCGDGFQDHPLTVARKFEQKNLFCNNVARAIPTVMAIQSIAHFAKNASTLEINCHRGLWAGFLRALLHVPNAPRNPNVDILAPHQAAVGQAPFIDPLPWTGAGQFASIEKYYGCILLVAPRSADEILFAKRCIAEYTGARIVYVGENTDEVYTFLRQVCTPPDISEIPTWFDCATEIYFFIKKDK